MRNNSDDEAIYEGIAADDIAHNRDPGQRLLRQEESYDDEEEDGEYYDEEEEDESESDYDDEEYSSGSEERDEDPDIAPANPLTSSRVHLDDEG